MSKNVITVRLDNPLQQAIEGLAATLERPRSWVIEQALQEYVTTNAWQLQEIQEGIDALDKGQGIVHETVKQRLLDKIRLHS
jgi:predicted transcriptional regulator